MFTDIASSVVLIRKNRPEFQAGLLNGVGGKIETERGESPRRAMVREFFEETGVQTTPDEWTMFAELQCYDHKEGDGWMHVVYCFVCKSTKHWSSVRTMTDETVELHAFPLPNTVWDDPKFAADATPLMRSSLIHNVPWLLEMATAKHCNDRVGYYTISERPKTGTQSQMIEKRRGKVRRKV
jgi:8-oxo-dGTP pyrophosphatase MutT (NUDIX family)